MTEFLRDDFISTDAGPNQARRGPRFILAKALGSKRSLSREIGAALAFKAVALSLLYFLFFDHGRRIVVTPAKMAAILIDKQPSMQR
jgi:hypothetical protein